MTTYPREVESVRLDPDATEVTEDLRFYVTADFVCLDLHVTRVNGDPWPRFFVHRLVGLGVMGNLQSQILHCSCLVHVFVVCTVGEYFLVVLLHRSSIGANALDEENAVAKLSREVIDHLRSLFVSDQSGVENLQRIVQEQLILLSVELSVEGRCRRSKYCYSPFDSAIERRDIASLLSNSIRSR